VAKKLGSESGRGLYNWYRISFWVFVVSLVMAGAFFEDDSSVTYLTFSMILFVSVLSTFVLSIIHLNKYKEKSLAIVGLVLTSLIILLRVFV
jgi:hypothetical protein